MWGVKHMAKVSLRCLFQVRGSIRKMWAGQNGNFLTVSLQGSKGALFCGLIRDARTEVTWWRRSNLCWFHPTQSSAPSCDRRLAFPHLHSRGAVSKGNAEYVKACHRVLWVSIMSLMFAMRRKLPSAFIILEKRLLASSVNISQSQYPARKWSCWTNTNVGSKGKYVY